MEPLAFKVLFRKKGTASAILAIALLIALLASINSVINNINSQASIIGDLSSIGQRYVITSRSAGALSDSHIGASLIRVVQNNSNVNYATGQQVVQGTLETENGSYAVDVLGVSNLADYLMNNQASVNGSFSLSQSQTDVGIILANLASIKLNDQLTVTISNRTSQLIVAGITQTSEQSDSELIMPLAMLQTFTQNSAAISFVEFSLNSTDNKALASVAEALPADVMTTKIQQVQTFVNDVNDETINFINVWSIAVYIVIAAASYLIATRVISEAKYELYMLKILGAKKRATVATILLYSLVIASVGTFLGVSIGVVGTQVCATCVRWFWGSFALAPFLQPLQAFQILLIALVSCLFGSLYPAARTHTLVAVSSE